MDEVILKCVSSVVDGNIVTILKGDRFVYEEEVAEGVYKVRCISGFALGFGFELEGSVLGNHFKSLK